MNVPLFDMTAELAPIRAEVDAAIKRVLDSGVFIGGPEVEAFERELAAAIGVRHAIGVSSGSDALHVLGMALGIGPGDEVVTTPLTFFATAGSFARLGAKIVFADIDDDTLTLDPAAALRVCTERTRAIIPVHLFGHPAQLPATTIPILEDAAQSLGGAAVRGAAAAVSMFPTKNLGALGDAGAVLTDDDELADRVRLLRSHGARPKYHHVALGGNFRLDAIQAAILRAKLPHLPAWTAARRSHAAHYRQLFAAADLPQVRLPADHPDHVYHQFVIRTPQRDQLRTHLTAAGVGTEIYYPEPLHHSTVFSFNPDELAVSHRACAELLALPIHPRLGNDARVRTVDLIQAFFHPREHWPSEGH